jgi:predicted small lipoprotein YifL
MHRPTGGDNMRFMKKVLFILVALAMAAAYGCGSKGPLYLPDKTPAKAQPAQQ